MKIILLLCFTIGVYAQSLETCYTVQLLSKHNSTKNLKKLQKKQFPDTCKLMKIGSSLTVRCGCYVQYDEAKLSFLSLKKTYALSSIATTYKYRFKGTKTQEQIVQKDEKKDDELRLILQVFLYKGDLQHAYKVAKLGVKKYPESYYWNEKMADTSRWTNRQEESMIYLKKMYTLRHDTQIEKQLILYAKQSHKYESIEPLLLKKIRKNPSQKNVDELIDIYIKTGNPEKATSFLEKQYKKDKTKKVFLTQALDLSLQMGNMVLAKKYVNMIEKQETYTTQDAALIARYYYIFGDVEKAYKCLDNVNPLDKASLEDKIVYSELKSDLGWYLQENQEAGKAAKYLIDHHKGRLVDYERVIFVYYEKNPRYVEQTFKEAYLKFKDSYLFYGYANGAIKYKNYDELAKLVKDIDASDSSLKRESAYWLIKAKLYAYKNDKKHEQEALTMAYSLEPNNMQIKLELLWFYVDVQDAQRTKILLLDMSQSQDLSPALYFPIASAYAFLNDINRASFYTQKLLALHHPVVKTIEFKFLQAYIYQSQNNQNGFKTYMQDIVASMQHQAKEKPKLTTQDRYLSNYLRAAMNVLHPDDFEKALEDAKPYLKKQNYDEIAYSWAIRNHADEKSRQLYYKMNKRALWLDFSDAIVSQNHSQLEDLLHMHLYSLSMADASQVAYKDGQVSLAQTITYENLNQSERDQNAYIGHLNLSKERSDNFYIKSAYYLREPLLRKYVELKNKTYIQDGYSVLARTFYTKNSSQNTTNLTNLEDTTLHLGLGIERLYNRGAIRIFMQYHQDMRDFMEYKIEGKYRLSTDLIFNATAGTNMEAQESTALLLGGKKDSVGFNVDWKILNSSTINFHLQRNKYKSQDDVALGDGTYGRLSALKLIRQGYPDIGLGLFSDFGNYKELKGSKGVIDTLNPLQYNVLPENFFNLGASVAYGMVNSNIYTRVWRPYFEFSPYYNSAMGSFTYSFHTGIGGKVWHQDHLSLGASYSDSVNGIEGKIFELYLKYQFMYYHP